MDIMRISASTRTRFHPDDAAGTPRLRALRALLLVIAASTVLVGCDTGDSGDGIDPGVVEIQVAYIKRPIPVDEDGDDANADVREPRLFSSGGDVYLRSSSTTDVPINTPR